MGDKGGLVAALVAVQGVQDEGAADDLSTHGTADTCWAPRLVRRHCGMQSGV